MDASAIEKYNIGNLVLLIIKKETAAARQVPRHLPTKQIIVKYSWIIAIPAKITMLNYSDAL